MYKEKQFLMKFHSFLIFKSLNQGIILLTFVLYSSYFGYFDKEIFSVNGVDLRNIAVSTSGPIIEKLTIVLISILL